MPFGGHILCSRFKIMLSISAPQTRLIATGGASNNQGILQVRKLHCFMVVISLVHILPDKVILN